MTNNRVVRLFQTRVIRTPLVLHVRAGKSPELWILNVGLCETQLLASDLQSSDAFWTL
jgi:hypothetical protein